jgi:hypothetical protein
MYMTKANSVIYLFKFDVAQYQEDKQVKLNVFQAQNMQGFLSDIFTFYDYNDIGFTYETIYLYD